MTTRKYRADEAYREAMRYARKGPIDKLETAVYELYELATGPRDCPYCGRFMSAREATEQLACNDCVNPSGN